MKNGDKYMSWCGCGGRHIHMNGNKICGLNANHPKIAMVVAE